jgi:hypothetical protein
MISLEDRPPQLILSGTTAWFKIKNTGDDKRVTATIKQGPNTIARAVAFASVGDTALFQLSEFLSAIVEPEYNYVSVPGSAIVRRVVGMMMPLFEITFSDEDDNAIVENIHVLYGHLSPDLIAGIHYGYGLSNTVHKYLLSNPILSLKPDGATVFYPEQPEELYFLSPDNSLGLVEIFLTIYYNTGVTQHLKAGDFSPSQYEMFVIDASYSGLVEPNRSVIYKDLSVSSYKLSITTGKTAVASTHNYHINFTPKATGSFRFVNSLGGIDTFCPQGTLSVESQMSIQLSENSPAPGLFQPLFTASEHAERQVFVQNTGHLTQKMAAWLSQMIYSRRVLWHPKGKMPYPISLVDNKLDVTFIPGKLSFAAIKYIVNPDIMPESI